MTLIRIYPDFEVFEGLSEEDKSWLIARDFGICNGWRVNFAVDERGASFGSSGSSADVSSELDRLLLGKLRSLADIIVTSGKTARAEKYRSSKHAPIAIFSKSGHLDTVPAIQGTQYFTPLVLTPAPEVDRLEYELSDVDVRVLGYGQQSDSRAWPLQIADLMRHEGFQSPILESGLSTIREFIDSGVIDEICLTVSHATSSQISSREVTRANLGEIFGSTFDFELLNLFSDGNSTFTRWRRGSSN